MRAKYNKIFNTIIIVCLASVFSGCDNGTSESHYYNPSPSTDYSSPTVPSTPSTTDNGNGYENSGNTNTSQNKPASTPLRDSTPQVKVPTEGGEKVASRVCSIDYSNRNEGYILANYFGSNPKVKLQIVGPDSVTYNYDLPNHSTCFALSAGNGSYKISIYENISGTKYSLALTKTIDVALNNELLPFLYPNQFVDFNSSSLCISVGQQLASGAKNDLDVVAKTYNYIINNFKYDYEKAKNLKAGYLPNIDTTMQTKIGICFDYASVISSILRSQRIPTRLEIGYAGTEYHAWISVYIKDVGWINGIIQFSGNTWTMMDPTFASTSRNPIKFIPNKEKYKISFVY
ncbi:transglutaminase domain-containing protein [Lachnobacterium bovis]|uniref:transglutaminase domain-containing protein n=1 Tax=Lachnobacterium bovis TaxID=140626 RepID=UPI0003B578DE|nr:transglutaminase-like domain-containing protein [Lachnobacterium bovis]